MKSIMKGQASKIPTMRRLIGITHFQLSWTIWSMRQRDMRAFILDKMRTIMVVFTMNQKV